MNREEPADIVENRSVISATKNNTHLSKMLEK